MTQTHLHGRSSVHLLRAHIVFVTKYRRRALTSEILTRCREIADSVAERDGFDIIEFNGEADHVHILVGYPPATAVSALVGALKGATSHALRVEYGPHLKRFLWGKHLWSPSYFAASAGGATLETIKRYIGNQSRPE